MKLDSTSQVEDSAPINGKSSGGAEYQMGFDAAMAHKAMLPGRTDAELEQLELSLMAAVDAYAVDYERDRKLSPSRWTVVRALREALR